MYKCRFLNIQPRRFQANLSSWSSLAETFNNRPNQTNIKLPSEVGLFNVPELKTHTGFYKLQDRCLKKTDELTQEALSYGRTRKMIEVFDELSDSLCQVADLAEFVRLAHPHPDYAQAAESACSKISGIVEKLNTNAALYKALKKAVIQKDIKPTTEVDKLVGELFLFDFEQSGIHLSQEIRNKVVHYNNLILTLGQQFSAGTATPKLVKKKNIPKDLSDFFCEQGEDILVTGLYTDSWNALAREIGYRIYLHPDRHQEQLLTELLKYRYKLARSCGFATYAERALRGGTVEDPKGVMSFLDDLNSQLRERAQKDFAQMEAMKAKESPAAGKLAAWDVPYFTQKAKREWFRVSSKEYSPYFSLGACMEGLNMLFRSLYGITLDSSEIGPGEVWHYDVYKLAVNHETEGTLGYIYCDFYERTGKPNQDCHFTIRGGRQLSDGSYQLPIVVLMLNLPTPRWSSPSLLNPSMVENLFHEMGHAMHSMLARTQYQHVSGTRCSTDFAEVPSVLMEYFASDVRVLKKFARHFQTNEPMSDDMLYRLSASKHLFSASETQLQVFYGVLDQVYHGDFESLGSTTDVLERIQNSYYQLPYIKNTAWHLRFSHLVGYGAKYYSYLVSKALAYWIWHSYFEADPFNRANGERYRKECLSFGGGKKPKTLIQDYLKLEPTPENLAKSLIREIDDYQRIIDKM